MCITSLVARRARCTLFVALLLAEAAKAISKPMEAAVEATSALFIWSATPYIEGSCYSRTHLGFLARVRMCREQSLVFGSRPAAGHEAGKAV